MWFRSKPEATSWSRLLPGFTVKSCPISQYGTARLRWNAGNNCTPCGASVCTFGCYSFCLKQTTLSVLEQF